MLESGVNRKFLLGPPSGPSWEGFCLVKVVGQQGGGFQTFWEDGNQSTSLKRSIPKVAQV